MKEGSRGSSLSIHREVCTWNELPEELVVAGTITVFKRHLNSYMNM